MRPGGFGNQRFADAAEKLGISVEVLMGALGSPPDVEAAADTLDNTVDKLREALPLQQRPQQGQ